MVDDCLPPNASNTERQIVNGFTRLSTLPVPINTLWDANQCPEALLPWLAWALSVDTWHADWPIAVKRQVILDSVQVHRHKGTVYAVKHALAAMTLTIEIVEWFDSASPAHTFKLQTVVTPDTIEQPLQHLTPKQQQLISQVVDAVKPVRSHYQLQAQTAWRSDIGVGDNLTGVSVVLGQMQLIVETTTS